MTKDGAVKIIRDAFADRDMYIEITGCGCCGSPWITVYRGDECVLDDGDFIVDEDDHVRNLKREQELARQLERAQDVANRRAKMARLEDIT